MSVEKQRELEEEEMRRQGRCFHDSVTREGIRSISCPRTVGRRRGDAIENRQRPEKGRKAGKVKRGVEKVKELNQKYFLPKVFKGEEGVRRVRLPDCDPGIHPEEIQLKEVKRLRE